MRDREPVLPETDRGAFIAVVLLVYAIPTILVASSALTSFGAPPVWQNLKVVAGGFAFFCIAVWGLHKEKIPFDDIGLTPPRMVEAVLLALAGWAVVVLVNYLVILVDRGDTGGLFGKPALYILQYWVFVGIAEELLFRGYILTRLMNVWTVRNKVFRRIGAVAVSSLLFATAHVPERLFQVIRGDMTLATVPASIVLLSIAGMVFSYYFLRTKNILWAGLVHGAMIVPLVGVVEDAFFPVVIVATIITEVFLFFQRRRLKKRGAY